MKSLIFTLSLLISLTGQAQQRKSILDDPDFLQNLGVDEIEEPNKLGAAPCLSCEKETEQGRIIPFRKERKTFTFTKKVNIPGVDCAEELRTDTGSFEGGPPAGAYLCMKEGKMLRDLSFRSDDGSRDGTFMYFNEGISALADSGNVKTAVLMLPRKTIPSVRLVGRELHLTLQTGELVVMDAVTKKTLRGPLSFGSLTNVKRATPYTYSGSAIVLSASNNYKMPFEAGGAPTINVRQGKQSCTIQRERLWNAEGKPISGTDAGMVTTLNQFCTPKPARAFSL